MKTDFYYGNRCIGKETDIKFMFLFFKMSTSEFDYTQRSYFKSC